MTKLSDEQKSFFALILRSPDIGDGWRQSSDMLWPHIQKWAHPDLTELDEENKRIRFTPEGLLVLQYI